jgi:hypothetical protein
MMESLRCIWPVDSLLSGNVWLSYGIDMQQGKKSADMVKELD